MDNEAVCYHNALMKILALAAGMVLFTAAAGFAQGGAVYGNAANGIELKSFRCKAACPSGKFRYIVFAINKSEVKASVDKNDLKFKLKFSYKPARIKTKGARRGAASGFYKTIDFMPAGNYAPDLIEVKPGEILGIREEIDVGVLDAGICVSDAITLHGTLPMTLESGPVNLEVNQQVKNSCEF